MGDAARCMKPFVDSAMRTIVSNAKYCLGVRELSDTNRVAGFSVTWRYAFRFRVGI
jgi:hypothetical protein